MQYRCEATSVEGFVQMMAANYLPHGYFFFVRGHVPNEKDPEAVDAKLMAKYGIGLSRQARARRKAAGLANLHYLRLERSWVLLATHGNHSFFTEEGGNIRDCRRAPIDFSGYSITVKRGQFLQKAADDEPGTPDGKLRVRVQVGRERYREIRAYLLEMACRRDAAWLEREFWNLPFEPYAPVRKQLLKLWRGVNRRRASAGLSSIAIECLRLRRRIVKPFERAAGDNVPGVAAGAKE